MPLSAIDWFQISPAMNRKSQPPKQTVSLLSLVVPDNRELTEERVRQLILKTAQRCRKAKHFLEERFLHTKEKPDGKNYQHLVDAIVNALMQPGQKIEKDFLCHETGDCIEAVVGLLKQLSLSVECKKEEEKRTLFIQVQPCVAA